MKTSMKIPEREPIGRVMARAGKLFLTEIRNQLPDISINRSFYPLMLIYSGNGELTQQELANLLKIDKVQVVRIVDYLSQHGYVERINNSSDRRKHLLCTTSKATIAMPFILAAFESVTQMAMKGLSSEQKDMLYQSMGIIEANLISNRKIKTNES